MAVTMENGNLKEQLIKNCYLVNNDNGNFSEKGDSGSQWFILHNGRGYPFAIHKGSCTDAESGSKLAVGTPLREGLSILVKENHRFFDYEFQLFCHGTPC